MRYGYGLAAALAGFGVFASIIGIVAYIFTALGLYKLAQKQGEPNAWLAWIPIAQLYIIGKIVNEVKLGTMTIPRMDLVLPLGALGVAVLSWIPVLGQLIALAYYALFIYTMYLLFKKYVPEQAVLYTVLSAIGLFWIFIFIIRDKDQVAE
jgi:heme A synthase